MDPKQTYFCFKELIRGQRVGSAINSTCCGSQPSISPVLEDLKHCSELCRHQAHTWCIYIHVGKTLMHIKIKEEGKEGRIIIARARGCQAMCVIAPDTNQSQKGAWAEVKQMFSELFLNQIFSLPYSKAKAKAEYPLGQNRKGKESLSKGELRAQDGFCYSQAEKRSKEAGRDTERAAQAENM